MPTRNIEDKGDDTNETRCKQHDIRSYRSYKE